MNVIVCWMLWRTFLKLRSDLLIVFPLKKIEGGEGRQLVSWLALRLVRVCVTAAAH